MEALQRTQDARAGLAQTLHAQGLIDEYRLFIEPVVLGTGKRLFEPGASPTALRLVESRPMGKGSVLAIYQPAGKPTYGEFQMEEGLRTTRKLSSIAPREIRAVWLCLSGSSSHQLRPGIKFLG